MIRKEAVARLKQIKLKVKRKRIYELLQQSNQQTD